MMRMLILFCTLFTVISCQTTSKVASLEKFKNVKLDGQTPTQLAIDVASERGTESIQYVSQLITKRKAWPQVYPTIVNRIEKNRKYSQVELFNLAMLYQSGPGEANTSFVQNLLASSDSFMNKLGWYIAASKPSPKIALVLDNALSTILTNSNSSRLHEPMMAMAVSQNNLRSAYSIMRQSLMQTGIEQFAEAMIHLNPSQASEDFLEYLNLAPTEELRQLTISSVNVTTCQIILMHMQKSPPSIHNPKFQQIFVFAVARNQSLSEMAAGVLESQFTRNRRYLAALLARTPEWLQIAYVEDAKHDMTAHKKLFLTDLRNTTPHEDVVFEINSSMR